MPTRSYDFSDITADGLTPLHPQILAPTVRLRIHNCEGPGPPSEELGLTPVRDRFEELYGSGKQSHFELASAEAVEAGVCFSIFWDRVS